MASDIRTRPVTTEYEQGFERAHLGVPTRKPGRTRYVWDEQAQRLVEVGSDWAPQERRLPVVGDAHYDNLRATDGTDISSRTKHRAYMKRNGLTTVDDYRNTWEQAAKERANSEVRESKERRETIGRTIYELERRKR